jgi:hypothetical protein
LGDFGVSWVRYVRINKTQVGYTYGRFIDAVEGVYGIPGSIGAGGRDQTVLEGTPVTLGSDEEVDVSETVSYAWEQLEGPLVVLSDSGGKNPQFVAPMIDSEDVKLRFEVTKTDAGSTTQDEVQIEIIDNGFQFSSEEAELFSRAEFVFNNEVGAENIGGSVCYTGVACEGGGLVFYEAQDPDSTLSSDYVDDFNNRPKNIIYGLFAFDVKLSAIGSTCVVSIYLPESAPVDYKWYKHSDSLGWVDFSRDTISDGVGDGAEFDKDRTVVTVYVTDGGPYDDDGAADGFIRDPSGLASSSTAGTWHDEGGGSCFINAMIGR